MTDPNVIVFGSFTEDEIKSLQSSSKKNDVQFMFGSLDSETLRSVGIFNNISSDIELAKKNQPSKLVKNRNTNEVVHTKAKESHSLPSDLHKNGHTPDSSSPFFRNGVKEQELNDAELPVSFVPGSDGEPLDQSISEQGRAEAVTVSSTNQGNEAFVRSFEAFDLLDNKNSIVSASNGPRISTTELLPRGLVNSGNLCFLNATLQALLACSPFVHLLQELRTRNIPKIEFPTLQAFVEFISGFDMPSGVHSKKKDNIVLEYGKAFRPVMFEPVLNKFSPDMPNSFSGRPRNIFRQEDAQEFLSFIMHQMHDELLKFEGGISTENGKKGPLVSSTSDEDDDNWETVGPKNKTAITRTQSFIPSKLSEIFGGQLKSVVKARGNKASGRTYELVATLTHHGAEPSKGHYTADILHPSGKWLRYDDASVVAISTKKVLHDQAYVLFYKQQWY
ncbi:ubiquitin-specific protease 24 [Artemisia annua]|uniref:Ubiquitin carboxyl-terminal hydrolase n=1 Tax=Artemisia annua TaxID=35608 RepID=A0A2U1MDC2_ARTAN|nr:ubiquitin-specific protease 24 [Artemisia annua]